MLRVALIVLGGPLCFLLIAQSALWLRDIAAEPVTTDVVSSAYVYRGYSSVTQAAHQRYHGYAPIEQLNFRRRLEDRLWSLHQWLEFVEARGGIICVGESHEDATRRFIAERLIPHLEVDLLALETTPTALQQIQSHTEDHSSALLLGAEIHPLLRQARKHNAALRVVPIDKPPGIAGGSSRERVMLDNFLRAYRPGDRALILLGALHCSNHGDWLRGRLERRLLAFDSVPVLGLRLVGEGQDGSIQSFNNFLDEIGLERDVYVVQAWVDAEWWASWFPLLKQQLLDRYDAVVVFRH